MIPSMLVPGPTDYGPLPSAAPTLGVEQGGRSHDKTVKVRAVRCCRARRRLCPQIVLEVIFIATAVFALLLCLLLRCAKYNHSSLSQTLTARSLLCLRRARRPLRDFLTPLPPAPARPRHAHDPSPPPSRSTSRSEQMRQTIFLPTLPISAPQHPPATFSAPSVPALSHPRSPRSLGDGPAGIAAHLAGLPRWPPAGARPPARRVDTLPLYDAKDAPPRYEDAVLPSPGASEAAASSPPALEGLETDLGRSAGR